MAEPTSTTPGCSPGTPADDSVFGSLIVLTEVRVLVGIQLQGIERVAEGTPIPISLVMAPKSAVRLAHKLNRAVTRLSGVTP